ncbi:amino acid ABC transporter substrate-binding protein, partial [Burkholderia multivorans]
MNFPSRLTALLVTAGALAAGTAHAAEPLSGTLEKIRQTNLISIGHRETSVPFSYVDASGKVIGFSQDLCDRVIAAVKARTGKPDLQVRFIPVTSQNRIPLVQNGTVDLECGVTTNLAARHAQVAFSTTFFVATTRLLTRTQSGIRDFPDLAGKTVVTNQGTTSERLLRKMNEEKKMNMQIISAKDYGEGRLTLESGRA